jgi:hypothetical protein
VRTSATIKLIHHQNLEGRSPGLRESLVRVRVAGSMCRSIGASESAALRYAARPTETFIGDVSTGPARAPLFTASAVSRERQAPPMFHAPPIGPYNSDLFSCSRYCLP